MRPPDVKTPGAGGRPGAGAQQESQRKFDTTVAADAAQPEQPEHDGDKRKFLIWACMLGAILPQRVVERVVAEVEREAETEAPS